MTPKHSVVTAKIGEFYCVDCGWPVIDSCVNDEVTELFNTDWLYYCSNKGCINHKGVGVDLYTKALWIQKKP